MKRKIAPVEIRKNMAFIQALSDLLSSDGQDQVIRDLCEVQSLITSHQLLRDDEFQMDTLRTTLHELELVLRFLRPRN